MVTTPALARPAVVGQTLAVGTLVLALLAGCGGSGTTAAPPTPTSATPAATAPPATPTPTATAAPDVSTPAGALALVRAAGKAVQDAGTVQYEFATEVDADGDDGAGEPETTTVRSGLLDATRGVHQVRLDVAAQDEDSDPVSLTVLTTPTQVLMDDPGITRKTGRRWTSLPAGALAAAAPGVDLSGGPALPGVRVLSGALGPASLISDDDDGGHFVGLDVDEYEVLELLGGGGLAGTAARMDLNAPALQRRLDRVVVVGVDLDADGRLRGLDVDISDLLRHLAVIGNEQPAPVPTTTYLRADVHDVGAPVSIDVPTADAIAEFPSS